MDCSVCDHANPEGAHFCGECGASLAIVAACPSCGHENPAGQRFCNGCGLRLEPGETPPESPAAAASIPLGERKQVTVLFCDIAQSMELGATYDAEEWRTLMARFFDLVCEEVEALEGTVDKFTGDGAMAVFGAPVALEDHAARACHTALRLGERLGELPFGVRIGLNSGEVVVGGVGSQGAAEYTAIGNTVGLAARMESVAEPGRPCLTAATAALVEGLFELHDRGGLEVKGIPQPVHGFALTGQRGATRLEATRGHGWSRFVGRGEELAALEVALLRAEKSGQAVGVVAEPGLGKSRLCREFVHRCRERGFDVTVGRGVAHGKRVPLLPVIQMLRAWFGVEESDEPVAAQRKIGGRLLELDARFAEALPVVYDFLGVPAAELSAPQMSPEARQRALLGVVRRLTEARAAEGPAVLVIEDLHWLDPGSESFLETLVDSLPGSRTLLVVNFRPEYSAPWTGKSFYHQIALTPLADEALTTLFTGLVGAHPSVDGLAELVGERTGGNPFFVEEVVQGMIESGTLAGDAAAYELTRSIEAIEIPATVQAVLAARIDRLADREKAVLGSASVIGRNFSEAVLRAVTGLPENELSTALAVLGAAELVYEKSPFPDAEYSFKHALTEEVAYRSQLIERRRLLHGAVADAIEAVYADRLDELAALLANHREAAGDTLAAARWNARAAGWAGHHNPADALRHWQRVRSLLSDAPETEEGSGLRMAACMWTLSVGWRLGCSRREIEEVLAEGIELAEASGHEAALVAVRSAAAVATGMNGDVPAALEQAREADRLGRDAGLLELRIAGGLHYLSALSGDLVGALRQLDEIDALIRREERPFEVGRASVGFSMLIWNIFFRGQILRGLGRLDEAKACAARAIELAAEHDDVETLGWTYGELSTLAYCTGESEDGLAHALRALELSERLGSAYSRGASYANLAQARLGRGEAREAEDAARTCLAALTSSGTGLQYEALYLAALSEAQLARDPGAALRTAVEGVAAGERNGTPGFGAEARLMLGRALVATGEHARAEAELLEALAVFERLAPGCVPWAQEALADLAAARGEVGDEQRRLEAARALYEQHGATGRERRVAERLSAPQLAARGAPPRS